MNTLNLFSLDDEILIGEKHFYTFKEAADIIGKKGLGRNKLLKLLRNNGVFNQWNHPTEDYENTGLFKMVSNRHLTPLISSYGINFIKKYLL